MANWSRQDVWNYIKRHKIPYNPLHEPRLPSSPTQWALLLGDVTANGIVSNADVASVKSQNRDLI